MDTKLQATSSIQLQASEQRQFYTYLYLREDNTPYYAGKGFGKRVYSKHRVGVPKDENRILIFPMINEAEAFESEIALISLFGRKDNGTGILRNMTDGGEGSSNPSEEIRRKNSEAQRGNKRALGHKHSEEALRKISEASRNISEETRKKISDALRGNTFNLGRKHSEETRRKMSEAGKRKVITEEHCRNISAAKKGVPFSDEHRRKLSEAHLGKPLSEEHRRSMRKAHKKRLGKQVGPNAG